MNIENEQPDDHAIIEKMYHEIFGPSFPNMERTANLLRADGMVDLSVSFVIRDCETGIKASIRNWRISIIKESPKREETGWLLGPILVLPSLRGKGFGRGLIAHTQKLVGVNRSIITIGDPGYFVPLGFHVIPPTKVLVQGEISPLSLMHWGKPCDTIIALRSTSLHDNQP